MINILLVCGSGASSGFVSQDMRKSAKARGLDVRIKAVSDSEILDYIEDFDILLIGPHIKHRESEIKEKVAPYGVKTAIIDTKYYAVLDGEGVLNQALALMEKK